MQFDIIKDSWLAANFATFVLEFNYSISVETTGERILLATCWFDCERAWVASYRSCKKLNCTLSGWEPPGTALINV